MAEDRKFSSVFGIIGEKALYLPGDEPNDV